MIAGDPLTGALPRTRLVVATNATRPTRTRRPQWPVVPDREAIAIDQLHPGRVAYVRTRRGVRRYLIRTAAKSRERGSNRGRTYVAGMSRLGLCRAFWADRVVSTRSIGEAIR